MPENKMKRNLSLSNARSATDERCDRETGRAPTEKRTNLNTQSPDNLLLHLKQKVAVVRGRWALAMPRGY
jgi:hypothetical protein